MIDFKYHNEVDGKQHDSHLERPILKLAFEIFFDSFEESRERKLWKEYFYRSYVYKKYVTNTGNIFLVDRGTPTGHSFTSIINSIATWII